MLSQLTLSVESAAGVVQVDLVLIVEPAVLGSSQFVQNGCRIVSGIIFVEPRLGGGAIHGRETGRWARIDYGLRVDGAVDDAVDDAHGSQVCGFAVHRQPALPAAWRVSLTEPAPSCQRQGISDRADRAGGFQNEIKAFAPPLGALAPAGPLSRSGAGAARRIRLGANAA